MTASKIESARKLLVSGMPPREVAQNLGVSVPTLYRWLPASGYVLLSEDAEPVEVEQAELALLQDVLDWCTAPGAVRPLNAVYPLDWTQSAQLEVPYGWVALKLDVRT